MTEVATVQKVSSSEYDSRICCVYSAVASLKQCRRDEIPNEVNILRRSVANLEGSAPKRRSKALAERAMNALQGARDAIAKAEERAQQGPALRATKDRMDVKKECLAIIARLRG